MVTVMGLKSMIFRIRGCGETNLEGTLEEEAIRVEQTEKISRISN